MKYLSDLKKYSKVLIMGLGLFGGGVGAARFWAEIGAKVIVTDLASPEKLTDSINALADLDIEFVLGRHREEDFKNVNLIMVNQAVKPSNHYLEIARKSGVEIITETGLALLINKSPVIAITGSSGKSTTSSLIYHICKENIPDTMFGGNIGGDLLTRITKHNYKSPLIVELSTFQLTYLHENFLHDQLKSPNIAVITNLAPNHLDWHKNLEEYYLAKFELLKWQKNTQWAVINVDDTVLEKWLSIIPAKVLATCIKDNGWENVCFVRNNEIVLRINNQELFKYPLMNFKLLGQHNIRNALQAVAVCYIYGCDAYKISSALTSFKGLKHRLDFVAKIKEVSFYNDSKSTTVESTITALKSFTKKIVVILGGSDKQANYDSLVDELYQKDVKVVLIGETAKKIANAIDDYQKNKDKRITYIDCKNDFNKAIMTAKKICPESGIVLLSPACASYDMFKNYEERGNLFIKIVQDYI